MINLQYLYSDITNSSNSGKIIGITTTYHNYIECEISEINIYYDKVELNIDCNNSDYGRYLRFGKYVTHLLVTLYEYDILSYEIYPISESIHFN